MSWTLNLTFSSIVEYNVNFSLKNDYERVIQFDVTVKEELTGRKQNNSAQTILHKHKYSLELVKTSEYFKPGLKYTVFVSCLLYNFIYRELYISLSITYLTVGYLIILFYRSN